MPETPDKQAEIAELERKLDASRDRAGYGERTKAIEAKLAELRK